MTHALQVLHTLQWHHPGGRALVRLAQAPNQDYHSYTHTLLGVVEEYVVGLSDSPVKKTREHSAAKQLWPNRGRHNAFPLLGLGGKRCSFSVHGAELMKSDSQLCHRHRRSYLFAFSFAPYPYILLQDTDLSLT